jgi:hypothetical protein
MLYWIKTSSQRNHVSEQLEKIENIGARGVHL